MQPASNVIRLIDALHDSPVKLCLNLCGAGTAALSWLTQAPGCSRTLLRGDVLYSPQATAEALDYRPARFVSRPVARHLAQHAFHTSRSLCTANDSDNGAMVVLGVGATSAVRTSRDRRGVDQAFVCVWGEGGTSDAVGGGGGPSTIIVDSALRLPPEMSRQQQDEQVALLILHAIGQYAAKVAAVATAAAGQEQSCSASVAPSSLVVTPSSGDDCCLFAEPEVETVRLPASEAAVAIQSVLDGTAPVALFNSKGEARADCGPFLFREDQQQQEEEVTTAAAVTGSPGLQRREVRLLYPGSFRPLHWGHTELARAAVSVARTHFSALRQETAPTATITAAHSGSGGGDTVTYEIAASIIDKGAVSAADLAARVAQFTARGRRVAVTTTSLVVDKARLFPGHGFIVGVDTAARILDPKYYEGGSEAGMVAALRREIGGRECYFVVGGRAVGSAWEELGSLSVPEAVRDLFIAVPEESFRVDISSTELRARRRASTS